MFWNEEYVDVLALSVNLFTKDQSSFLREEVGSSAWRVFDAAQQAAMNYGSAAQCTVSVDDLKQVFRELLDVSETKRSDQRRIDELESENSRLERDYFEVQEDLDELTKKYANLRSELAALIDD